MRNLAKYFLALTVMGSGFYAAQQHRHPARERPGEIASARRPVAEPAASRGRPASAARTMDSLPVAALADVDRVPLLGADRTSVSPGADLTDAASVTKQPTLRRDNSSGASPDAELPPTESPPKPARQTAKQEAKRPAAENSPPKKHDPKTKPAAKTPDKDFQPPDFAREYQPYSEHLQSAQEGATERHDTSRQERDNGRPMENGGASSQARRQTPESSSDTPPTRHCISEGDTLRRLAERYLGSRDRYLDIFQANKDVLFDPQLIPIGVEIVIPAKTVIVAHVPPGSTTADEADATPGTGSGESHDETSAPPTAEHESLTPAS